MYDILQIILVGPLHPMGLTCLLVCYVLV